MLKLSTATSCTYASLSYISGFQNNRSNLPTGRTVGRSFLCIKPHNLIHLCDNITSASRYLTLTANERILIGGATRDRAQKQISFIIQLTADQSMPSQ